MTPIINILIVDDDPMVGESLKFLLSKNEDMCVMDPLCDGQQAVESIKDSLESHGFLPDVMLMDIQMPNMDGIEAVGHIKKMCPNISIMMLTTFQDEHNIKRALRAGAAGYLIKSTDVSDMAIKIRALMSGTVVMDPLVLDELAKPRTEKLEGLTKREFSIAQLVAEGYSNKEIGQQLFISEGTVRNNLSVILEKLQMRDRTQLAVFVVKHFQ